MRRLAFAFALTAVPAGCGDDGTPQPTGTTTASDPSTTAEPTTAGDTTAADTSGGATTGGSTGGTGDDTTGTTGTTAAETSDDTTGPPPVLSFEVDIQPILTATCVAGCHEPGGSGFAETTLDMTAGVAYAQLVDVPASEPPKIDRIEPGSTDMSYLWHKISGTQKDIGGVGANMPIGTTLEPSEVTLIEQWILGGALP